MTERFLYRQPHHALAALLDHDIQTVDRVGSPFTMERLCDPIRSRAEGVKCYLPPESVAKAEARVGDMLTNRGAIGWRLLEIRGDDLIFRNFDSEFTGRKDEMRIVQRDGKPFPWPERESLSPEDNGK
ncbi:hypothetical protein [Tautonia plasticadhaerens]|uniref:Uncharacterized protein n=1 Tax=Tautonia plasticadhaerens TaxID=2527974 RepID=A0A518H288_9BACT|nr:hypothetical protein [Tautonia plasticadhaerens]QDV34927.1 hypothetical protein ElP_28240 [Tautonia plasticadhaerens]